MGSVGKSEYKRHTQDKDRIICRILHGCLAAGHAEQLDPQASHMSKHLKREEDDCDEGFMLMIIDHDDGHDVDDQAVNVLMTTHVISGHSIKSFQTSQLNQQHNKHEKDDGLPITNSGFLIEYKGLLTVMQVRHTFKI